MSAFASLVHFCMRAFVLSGPLHATCISEYGSIMSALLFWKL